MKAPVHPLVHLFVGLIVFAMGVTGLLWPERVYPHDHWILSTKTERWYGRAWNWWVKRGFPVFILIVPGAGLFIGGFVRLL